MLPELPHLRLAVTMADTNRGKLNQPPGQNVGKRLVLLVEMAHIPLAESFVKRALVASKANALVYEKSSVKQSPLVRPQVGRTFPQENSCSDPKSCAGSRNSPEREGREQAQPPWAGQFNARYLERRFNASHRLGLSASAGIALHQQLCCAYRVDTLSEKRNVKQMPFTLDSVQSS